MQILTFSEDQANRVLVEEKSYFVLKKRGNTMCLPIACPHRGGPMHLSKVSECGDKLVCPWHDNSYNCKSLLRHALPLVKCRKKISVVANSVDRVAYWREERIMDSI